LVNDAQAKMCNGLRDDKYELSGEVELDDGFFETVSITRDKTEPLKRSRGSQRQTAVFVSVESRSVKEVPIIKNTQHNKES